MFIKAANINDTAQKNLRYQFFPSLPHFFMWLYYATIRIRNQLMSKFNFCIAFPSPLEYCFEIGVRKPTSIFWKRRNFLSTQPLYVSIANIVSAARKCSETFSFLVATKERRKKNPTTRKKGQLNSFNALLFWFPRLHFLQTHCIAGKWMKRYFFFSYLFITKYKPMFSPFVAFVSGHYRRLHRAQSTVSIHWKCT